MSHTNLLAPLSWLALFPLVALCVHQLALTPCLPATITVRQDGSGDATSIQTGINLAVAGDEIIVWPGTYYEAIDFLGKAITLRSLSGPAQTIIDGRHTLGSVVSFINGEPQTAHLVGFTITGGRSGTQLNPLAVNRYGVGVCIIDSSPTILHNVFSANRAQDPLVFGGGLAALSVTRTGAPKIIENVFLENHASALGGGLYARGLSVTVDSNQFIQNSSNFDGGGALVRADGIVSHNYFYLNEALDHGGGLFAHGEVDAPTGLIVSWNVLVENTAHGIDSRGKIGSGGGLYLAGDRVSVVNNSIQGNRGFGSPRQGGGAVVATPSRHVFSRNFIARNTGGGILCFNVSPSSLIGLDNILWENLDYQVDSLSCASVAQDFAYSISDPVYCEDGTLQFAESSPLFTGPTVIGAIMTPACPPVALTPLSWGQLKQHFSKE